MSQIYKLDIESLGNELSWCITSCFGEDGEEGPVKIVICDQDERSVSIRLHELIDGEDSQNWLKDTPKDAEWMAKELRVIADKLELISTNGSRCADCGELYNPTITDCCGYKPDALHP